MPDRPKDQIEVVVEGPDEEGWFVAWVVHAPGAVNQGRTRQQARVNALDALAVLLEPDRS